MYSFRASRIFMDKQAFTLVEMSIVLVIIGLLVGGVLSGQSLIRAAELRAVSSEYMKYVAAVNAFRDKYQAIPGDMTNASSFWTSIPGAAGCTPMSATCGNGNGNGTVDLAPAASTYGEVFQFWNELALAGIIEGSYTGMAGTAGGGDHVIGTNCPKSKVSNGGWGMWVYGNYAGDVSTYAVNYGNMLAFGAAASGAFPLTALLTPQETWNIDTKLDDGKPGTGKVIAREYNGFTAAATLKCTTSASQSDLAGLYNLTNSGTACSIIFAKVF